jgi:hypothetical protein
MSIMSEVKEKLFVEGENIYCKAVIHDVSNKTLLLVHGVSANADS